jgi:uncharacterized Zn-binding protein involved in type VI secretion
MGVPACTNGGGSIATTGPVDACKTPSPAGPVPVPYPNLAQLTQANGSTCSSKVKIDGKKPIDVSSEVSMSSGDEAGTAGGIVSSRFKGKCDFKSGSSRVKIEGKKLVYLGATSGHNGGGNDNVPVGAVVAPSQSKVKCMP